MKISHVINEGMAEDDVGEGIRVPEKIVQRQHTIPPTSSQKFPS